MIQRFLYLLLFIPLFGAAQDLKVIRLEYPTATLDMHTTERLSKSLSHIKPKDNAIHAAYKGALLTIRANFTVQAFLTSSGLFKSDLGRSDRLGTTSLTQIDASGLVYLVLLNPAL